MVKRSVRARAASCDDTEGQLAGAEHVIAVLRNCAVVKDAVPAEFARKVALLIPKRTGPAGRVADDKVGR